MPENTPPPENPDIPEIPDEDAEESGAPTPQPEGSPVIPLPPTPTLHSTDLELAAYFHAHKAAYEAALLAEKAATAARIAAEEADYQAMVLIVSDPCAAIPEVMTASEVRLRQRATYQVLETQQAATAASQAATARLTESCRLLAIRSGEITLQAQTAPNFAGVTVGDPIGVQLKNLTAGLGAMLGMSEASVNTQLSTSETLVNDLPATLTALEDGEISQRHAEIIASNAQQIPHPFRAKYEAVMVPLAKEMTVTRLPAKALMVRDKMHPESHKQRHDKAVEKRCVRFDAGKDGMATLSAYLPAVAAKGIMNRITDTAKALRHKDDPRTLGQLRADAFSDLLLNGVTSTADYSKGIRARVMVMVEHSTLMGADDKVAQLDGYGFIGAEQARAVMLECRSAYRVTYSATSNEIISVGTKRYQATSSGTTAYANMATDPIEAMVTNIGHTQHRAPTAMRDVVRLRDQRCRWMGCGVSAEHCDVDHTIAWSDGGTTQVENLSLLCRRHHGLKHTAGWSLIQAPGGVLHFTSSDGRQYTTYPAMVLNLQPAETVAVGVLSDRGDDQEMADRSIPTDQETLWDGEFDLSAPVVVKAVKVIPVVKVAPVYLPGWDENGWLPGVEEELHNGEPLPF